MEAIEIIDFSIENKVFFKKLNYEWINKYFVIEPSDEYVLNNPETAVIDKGGLIYYAGCHNEIVGTFAMIRVDDTTYEIAKMAVTETHQHRGIGRQLMDFAIQKAKQMRLHKLILYSNTSLVTAVNMYYRYGFREIPKTDFHNNRANIKMELILRDV